MIESIIDGTNFPI